MAGLVQLAGTFFGMVSALGATVGVRWIGLMMMKQRSADEERMAREAQAAAEIAYKVEEVRLAAGQTALKVEEVRLAAIQTALKVEEVRLDARRTSAKVEEVRTVLAHTATNVDQKMDIVLRNVDGAMTFQLKRYMDMAKELAADGDPIHIAEAEAAEAAYRDHESRQHPAPPVSETAS